MKYNKDDQTEYRSSDSEKDGAYLQKSVSNWWLLSLQHRNIRPLILRFGL